MIERFVGDDAGYVAWLAVHPYGYVLNAYPHVSHSFLILHRASCRTVNRPLEAGRHWTSHGGKACCDDRDALEAWALAETEKGVEPHGPCFEVRGPRATDVPVGLPQRGGPASRTAPATATPPRLFELAYCCWLYGQITKYDASLNELRGLGELDPFDRVDQAALFKFLRAWGCRQFAKRYERTSARSLVHWSKRWLTRLPEPNVHLTDLSPSDVAQCAAAYDALRICEASRRKQRDGRFSRVRYGATGAAKTLFVLRPNVFPPWDGPIRSRRRWPSVAGFEAYLIDTGSQLRRLSAEAGVALSELPGLVGRPASSPPKLIDEYNWVTLTRGLRPPTATEAVDWGHWAAGGAARDEPAR